FLAPLTEFSRIPLPWGRPESLAGRRGRRPGGRQFDASLIDLLFGQSSSAARIRGPGGCPSGRFSTIQISPIAKEGLVLRSNLRYRNFVSCIVGAALTGALSILAVAGASADESEPVASSAFTVIPGGIADAGGTVAYLANATEGIDAIDMSNGKPLWDTKQGV